MPEKFNAARRVRNILVKTQQQRQEKTQQQRQDTSTMSMWTLVFDAIDNRHMDLPDNKFEVFRLLGLLNEQFDIVKAEAAQSGIDESHYHEPFIGINAALGPTNFDAPWENYGRRITQEELRVLGIFADLSPVDEQVVPSEDFANLREDLDSFLAVVMDKVTDDRLRAFVVKQIHVIFRAIREYPIRGEEAIRNGDSTLLVNFLSNHDLVREHSGEEVVKETMSLWERLTNLLPWGNFGINVARMLMDVDPQKAIEAGTKAIEAGSDMVDRL